MSKDWKYPLTAQKWGPDEIAATQRVLRSGQLTMGAETRVFEDRWASMLGVETSIMVNSGSSANLLAVSALIYADHRAPLRPGDEVIVPAVAWSTTVFPIFQAGCIPVLVDVDARTYNASPQAVEAAVTERTRAIVVVHLLGNPCDMEAISTIAARHHLWVIEDCCEAHGARIGERAVGSFGDLATFSFYFSHHMTTIEGGIINSRDREPWYDVLASLRAHGWIRERSDASEVARRHPEIDPRWLFVLPGFNVRPTEVAAAIGNAQMDRLPEVVSRRAEVWSRLSERLRKEAPWISVQYALPSHHHSGFGLGMTLAQDAPVTRDQFRSLLENSGIETRPIVAGNLARQPAMQRIMHRKADALTNADELHLRGLLVGSHEDLLPEQEDLLVSVVASAGGNRGG